MPSHMRISRSTSSNIPRTPLSHRMQNNIFFDKVSYMGKRLRGKNNARLKTEIKKIMKENNINEPDVSELQRMGSELEELLSDEYQWEKVNNAIQNKKYKQYFLSMVNNGASSAVSIATTPFRYMARGVAGLVLLAVTDRATNMSEQQINESTIKIIDDIDDTQQSIRCWSCILSEFSRRIICSDRESSSSLTMPSPSKSNCSY